ncbi:hypothetical protein ACFL3D_05530 [Candidatus Omnitrophota bacterium]
MLKERKTLLTVCFILIVWLISIEFVWAQNKESDKKSFSDIIQTSDQKTQDMLNDIQEARLALHPAQYYEEW